MTSAPNYVEILEKFRAWNGEGPGKGKEAGGLLIKPKEELQLLRKQILSQSVLQEEQLDYQRQLEQKTEGRTRARQGLETTTWSTLTDKMTVASKIGVDPGQLLRNTKTRRNTGNFAKKYALLKENPDGQTFRAFMHSLPTQWDILPQNQNMIRKYYEVKGSQKGQFRGVRRNYHVWQRRFKDIAHSQPLAEPLESVKTFIIFEDQSVVCTDNEEVEDRGVVCTDNKETEH
jgi:hypothetical protein